MILSPFEVHRPETLDETLALAGELAGNFGYLAGGTDALQNYKNKLNVPKHVITLDRVEGLAGVAGNRIGAMTRLSEIAADATVLENWPGLAQAVGTVASPLIRNSGTIGGNLLVETRCFWFNQTPFWRSTKGSCLKAESDTCRVIPQTETCYAAFSGDLAPILMALGAAVELASTKGTRTVPLADFYCGDGIERHVKTPEEILLAVILPDAAATLRSGYRKLRHRDALDYPEMGVAAAVRLDSDGCVDILRCADTAVDTVPHHVDYSVEHAGRKLTDVAVLVAEDMEDRAQPRKNTSMPVGYRKKMVRVFLMRLLHDLAEGRTVATD